MSDEGGKNSRICRDTRAISGRIEPVVEILKRQHVLACEQYSQEIDRKKDYEEENEGIERVRRVNCLYIQGDDYALNLINSFARIGRGKRRNNTPIGFHKRIKLHVSENE
ncbi:hypothetical protein ACS0PU_008799 [Formica fusca]